MKRFLILILVLLTIPQSAKALELKFWNCDEECSVKKVLTSQVKYANQMNFKKFVSTFAPEYKSGDGFNLDTYSSLVNDIWNTYNKIKYDIDIKNVSIENNVATVRITETAYAQINDSKAYEGVLNSKSNTIYKLKKINNKWKVYTDVILDETTSMLYGDARGLDIKLTVPNTITANSEYSAILEFEPPNGTMAVASIASDKVEYPQKPTKEVFRAMPEDNILERLFTSNDENLNEYIVASIGITKTNVTDSSIRMSLTGFGYAIKRVNVVPTSKGENVIGDIDVKEE